MHPIIFQSAIGKYLFLSLLTNQHWLRNYHEKPESLVLLPSHSSLSVIHRIIDYSTQLIRTAPFINGLNAKDFEGWKLKFASIFRKLLPLFHAFSATSTGHPFHSRRRNLKKSREKNQPGKLNVLTIKRFLLLSRPFFFAIPRMRSLTEKEMK